MNPEFPPGDIVIGTVIAPFKAVSGEAIRWLQTAEELLGDAHRSGFGRVQFFASIELDSRGLEPYGELLARLAEIDPTDNTSTDVWKFSIDDGATEIDGLNRLVRICTGRNLIHEYAIRHSAVSHVLFLDSDIIPPGDSISRLLEVDANIVGGDVPSYCLGGPVNGDYPFMVQSHWNTAGFLLVRRQVIRKLRWRADAYDAGSTDDPCFNLDAIDAGFGQTQVRKDVVGLHAPLKGLHARGHDLAVYK